MSDDGEEARAPARRRPCKAAPASSRNGQVRSAGVAARKAAGEVADLTGRAPESVVSVQRNDDGWLVGVEVVEVHRIPDSTDILAIYEAQLDQTGELVSYQRKRRYPRGQGDG